MAPYQFKKELGVLDPDGTERPPNARERERLHGFRPGHTVELKEEDRVSALGNSFHVIVVAAMAGAFAFWQR